MKELAIIITAFKQVNLTEKNILHIRNNLQLIDSPIVVVSTAIEDPGFTEMCSRHDGVSFLHFKGAPGNPSSDWKPIRRLMVDNKPTDQFVSWEHQYMSPRILLSLEKGFDYIIYPKKSKINKFSKIKSALHLHSDTFHMNEKLLRNEINDLLDNDRLFIGDISLFCEQAIANQNLVPKNIHWHIEGALINLEKAYSNGFMNFSRIWNDDEYFYSNNYGGTELLVGQWAHRCLFGTNIANATDPIHPDYYEKCKIRCIRPYHGNFGYLINLFGSQGFE